MAIASNHRGWLYSPAPGILAAVYNGVKPGTTAHGANTALEGVLLGTPVTPALAVDSMVISNMVASGDILLAANRGGNSENYVHVDSSLGALTLYAPNGAITLTPTTDVIVSNGTGIIVGATSQVTVSTGDGDTNLVAEVQILGTTQADSTLLIGCFSTTDATPPMLAFLKSGHGTIGSNTAVASGERLGDIVWFGADATDFESPAAAIRAEVDAAVGTGDMPGRIVFLATTDAGETLAEVFRYNSLAITVADDKLLRLGTTGDGVLVNVAAGLAATTALTSVVVGTPVTPTVAANSIIISNVTASGDFMIVANLGGNSQAWIWIDTSASLMTLYAAGVSSAEHSATGVVFNEASADRDFRVETNGIAYGFYADGAKDSVVIGSNTDTSSVDQLVNITRAARTATAATNYYDLSVSPAGAVTVPVGVTALVATAYFAEPNITNNGTLTAAATVYIANAPDEASSNYALFVDAGGARIDGDLTLNDAAMDVLIKAATAAAIEVSDGTTKFYAIDTRVATSGVTTHAFDVADYTIASGAAAVETGLSLAAHTLNYTGTTQVTTEAVTVNLGARSIAGDTATLTVDKASTLKVVAPTEGTNVTLTDAAAIRIANAAGTPTNQHGIYIEDLTSGATADYAIYVASAAPIHVGKASVGTGKIEFDGTTSGTVTLTVADTAGTWTMTLPAATGTNGQQLATNGSGVCSWTDAASGREYKHLLGTLSPQDALDRVLNTIIHRFKYRADVGRGTGDLDTEYAGILADEAPWAMHYNGEVFNPINAFGHAIAAIQALAARNTELENRLQLAGI